MTPTGCDSLTFAPSAEGSIGAPGITGIGTFPPISTTLKFDPEDAALKRAEVILPQSVQPNLPGAQRACSREAADASNCPESSRVGTATIDSPLQPAPVQGPVYVAFNTPAALPGLIVIAAGAGERAARRASWSRSSSARATRSPSNPDLPVRSFTLAFEGERPDAALTLVQDLCAEGTDRTMSVKLVAHNGKQSEFEQELATPGCDPRATVSIRRQAAPRLAGGAPQGRPQGTGHHRLRAEAAEDAEARQGRARSCSPTAAACARSAAGASPRCPSPARSARPRSCGAACEPAAAQAHHPRPADPRRRPQPH